MKSIVLFCLIAAAAAAPPASSGGAAEILKFENDVNEKGFSYAYAQSDGSKAEATGEYHPGTGKDDEGFVAVRGLFEWVGPDGVTYTGTYTADENGYKPQYTQGPNGVIPDEVLKFLVARK